MDQTAPSMRLLVISADAHFSYLVRRYAEQAQLEAVFAYLGEEPLAAVLQQRPAIILIEADQPADCLALLHALKTHRDTAPIPVVLCAWQGDFLASPPDGAAACLQKPILYETFQRTMAAFGARAA